jgi:hypothetical protein
LNNFGHRWHRQRGSLMICQYAYFTTGGRMKSLRIKNYFKITSLIFKLLPLNEFTSFARESFAVPLDTVSRHLAVSPSFFQKHFFDFYGKDPCKKFRKKFKNCTTSTMKKQIKLII